MTLTIDSTVSVSSQQVSCDLAGEAVILNLGNGQYYGLNPVGARIWELLQSGSSLAEVREVLLREYQGIDEERCTRELLDIVAKFVDAGLLVATR